MSAFARARQVSQKIAAADDSDSEDGISGDELDDMDEDMLEDEGAQVYDSMSESEEEGLVKEEDSAVVHPFLATSTWRPTADNFSAPSVDGWQVLKLKAQEQATFLGQYEFRVTHGIVNVAGALCRGWPDATHRVFAPSTHALPVVQCLSDEGAIIKIRRAGQSIRKLSQLSPLFRKIWSHSGWEDAPVLHDISQRGFSYVMNPTNDPLKRPLKPLIVDERWQNLLNYISFEKCSREGPMTCVLGYQGAGKSTFCRLLLNRMLTLLRGKNERLFESVCYLDLDPGQSEFTPCAQVSLVQVTKPMIGPPFTHCTAGPSAAFRVLRAHAISATSMKDDMDHVAACAKDLLQRYSALSANAKIGPLIINTPGAVRGLSLDALLSIVQDAKPDHVVFFAPDSDESSADVRKALEGHKAELHLLSRIRHQSKSRTSAHLRDMQTMSYFHTSTLSNGHIFWQSIPISADTWNFVALRFSGAPSEPADGVSKGSDKGVSGSLTGTILGVASLAEQPPAGHLATVIDGNILAAVYIEDDKTLDLIRSSLEPEVEPSPKMPKLSAKKTSRLLQPDKTNLVGLVIVQHMTSAELTVHSPDPDTLTRACSSGRVVLVRRNVEAPGWAYTEPVYLTRSWRQRDLARWRAESVASGNERHGIQQPRGDRSARQSDVWQDDMTGKWVSCGKTRATRADPIKTQPGQEPTNGKWQRMTRGGTGV